MKTSGEQHNGDENKNVEPSFIDTLREFDASDSQLLISYARHIDHAGLHTEADVDGSLARAEETYLHLVRQIFHGDMGTVDERSLVVAQVLDDLIDRRIALFREYAQMTSQTVDDRAEAREELLLDVQRALTDSAEEFRDEMLNQLYAILKTDAQIVDALRGSRHFSNSLIRVGNFAITHAKDVIKISAGVAIGTMVAQRYSQR